MGAVLITGSNRGIGLELVKAYLAQSRPVIACARDPEHAEALRALEADHIDLTLEALDVADPGSVRALKSRLGSRPLDIVINNAGVGGPFLDQEPDDDLDIDAWLKTLHVNTVAPLHVLRQLRPNLAAGTSPKAVTITSQMGAMSFQMPNTMVAYCASKAATNKIMHMLVDDFKKDGIAVQLIHPGWVRTEMGGSGADIGADESAAGIVQVVEQSNLDNSGRFTTYKGEPHAW